jgi:DNA repair exonuclease SbcCD ATPase subunit
MTLNLSIVEIAVLFFCAVTLGVVIHFFIVSRRNLNRSPMETGKIKKDLDNWKLRYFNDVETKDKELAELRSLLSEAEDNNRINQIEIDELNKQKRRIQTDLQSATNTEHSTDKGSYIEQLRQAQMNLLDHNERISQLLVNIEVIKENEEKQKLIEEENEELVSQVRELKYVLNQKETEINNIQQKEQLTREMTSMLDHAYSDFNTLQSKIQKLETQVSASRMLNLEFEDMKEANQRVTRDYEDQKIKLQAATLENQQLTLQLNEVEDKLREANFQRQQLQKRVSYLEELNEDLQMVADANKKLEHQLRRIGELESMLNVVSEENQHLKRQANP